MTTLPFVPAAVLFDMDGLMIDSESAVLACWTQAAAEHALLFDDAFLLSMVGLHDKLCRALIQDTFPNADVTALFARTAMLYEEKIDSGLPLKPGITSLLQWLHEQNVPKAVATSTQRATAERNLSRTGLRDYFPIVVTGSDIEHPKPAPDIYLKTALALGVAPADCLVLEDSEPGVRAALAAGMTPIQIPDLKQPDAHFRSLGHRVLDSLSDAHRLLQATFAAGVVA